MIIVPLFTYSQDFKRYLLQFLTDFPPLLCTQIMCASLIPEDSSVHKIVHDLREAIYTETTSIMNKYRFHAIEIRSFICWLPTSETEFICSISHISIFKSNIIQRMSKFVFSTSYYNNGRHHFNDIANND